MLVLPGLVHEAAVSLASVCSQLGWLGFSLHVVFHRGLHPAWWSQGSKKAGSNVQVFIKSLPASCLLVFR